MTDTKKGYFRWFSDPRDESSAKKRVYRELLEAVTRPITETVGSSLGGCFAYNEIVARSGAKAPFDDQTLRDRLFGSSEPTIASQLSELDDTATALARDADKRLAKLSAVISSDAWNLVELAVEKILAGDATAAKLIARLVARDEPRRDVHALLVVAAAVKTLDATTAGTIAVLAKMTFDENSTKRRARRRLLVQLGTASDLCKSMLYCPLTNFCSLAVWLRETLENEDVEPLKLYTDYINRENELKMERGGSRPSRRDDGSVSRRDENTEPPSPPQHLVVPPTRTVSDATTSSRGSAASTPLSGGFWGDAFFNDFVEDEGPIFI